MKTPQTLCKINASTPSASSTTPPTLIWRFGAPVPQFPFSSAGGSQVFQPQKRTVATERRQQVRRSRAERSAAQGNAPHRTDEGTVGDDCHALLRLTIPGPAHTGRHVSIFFPLSADLFARVVAFPSSFYLPPPGS